MTGYRPGRCARITSRGARARCRTTKSKQSSEKLPNAPLRSHPPRRCRDARPSARGTASSVQIGWKTTRALLLPSRSGSGMLLTHPQPNPCPGLSRPQCTSGPRAPYGADYETDSATRRPRPYAQRGYTRRHCRRRKHLIASRDDARTHRSWSPSARVPPRCAAAPERSLRIRAAKRTAYARLLATVRKSCLWRIGRRGPRDLWPTPVPHQAAMTRLSGEGEPRGDRVRGKGEAVREGQQNAAANTEAREARGMGKRGSTCAIHGEPTFRDHLRKRWGQTATVTVKYAQRDGRPRRSAPYHYPAQPERAGVKIGIRRPRTRHPPDA